MKILNKEKLERAIEQRICDDLAQCNIGGASLLVVQAGKLLYKKHVGTDDQTIFRLASMTKPITAVATMILVERGALSLDDPIDRFYPDFSKMVVYGTDSQAEIYPKITVKHLLTHTSGIGSGVAWDESLTRMTDRDIESVEKFIDFLSRQPLSYLPETRQEYSGIGAFSVLTGIIQKLTGMSYAEFLKKEIFEPCQMTEATFEPSAEQWRRVIEMHDKKDGQNVVGQTYDGCVFEWIPPHNYLGGAGLVATMEDYWNFACMLMNGGAFNGKRILSPSSVEVISTPYFPTGAKEHWGLGVRVITNEQKSTLPLGTFGWSGAYGTHFWIDPTNEIIGIYMKNSRYDGGSGARTSKNFEIDVYSALN